MCSPDRHNPTGPAANRGRRVGDQERNENWLAADSGGATPLLRPASGTTAAKPVCTYWPFFPFPPSSELKSLGSSRMTARALARV